MKMREHIRKKKKKKFSNMYKSSLQLIAVGSVTGIFSGAVITFFTILAHEGEEISRNAYAYVRANPAFIPLLLLALLAGAFLISVAVAFSSVIRGCGIPQAEGATRGSIRLQWWKDAVAMFTSSLIGIFMGLSVGAEGPSVLIGACVGDGVAKGLHRNEMIRRYQVTGGACVGLAVASNAPLTGIVFAVEEAHKRFTPEVFVCAFSSVIFGMLTRSVIYSLLGMQIESSFHSYVFQELPFSTYGFVILSGLICGWIGIAFHKMVFVLRGLFKKVRHKNSHIKRGLRIMIVVLIGGALALVAEGIMGGGHGLIESLGTYGGTAEPTTTVFGVSLVWTLMIVLALKFIVTGINVGAGLPCGIFIPIIAMGACVGSLLNHLWGWLGLEKAYYDLMVMICLAALFATLIRAPITAIIMICEFTGSFAYLLPVIIAVSIGYTIGETFRTDGIYEDLLEVYEQENGIHENAVREVFVIPLRRGAIADKREVRDVLWPAGARVKEIRRGEETILPDGDTILHDGDVLTIVCKTDSPQKAKDDLLHILE